MIFADRVWVPSQKDLVAEFSPQRVMRGSSVALAAVTNLLNLYTVPRDAVLVLTTGFVRATGGGAQLATASAIRVRDASGVELAVIIGESSRSKLDLAGVADLRATFSGQVFCMPEETVEVVGTFDAGVGANTVEGSITGVLMPRGNFQFA